MPFWFCFSCKKMWHSNVPTPADVKRIRCFYCLKNTSVRLKDEKQINAKLKSADYDRNVREFLKVRNGKNKVKAVSKK